MKRFIPALLLLLLPLCAQAQDTIHVAPVVPDTGAIEGTVRPRRTEPTSEGRVRERRTTVIDTDEPFETEYEKAIRHRQYLDGFRIQVCARGNTNADHQRVRETGKRFKGYFREWRVEVRLITPRWVLLAGDFYTRREAEAALRRVQATHKFKSATIVRAKIKNAKYKRDTDQKADQDAE